MIAAAIERCVGISELVQSNVCLLGTVCVSLVCTLVQHTVIRAIAVSYGRPPTLTLSESETTEPIDTNFGTIDNVGDISGCAKNHNNRLNRGAPIRTRNITSCVHFFCVLRLAHSANAESHTGQRRLKIRVSLQEVSYGDSLMTSVRKGSKTPKTVNFDAKEQFPT